jgi:hypothetical protein
MQAVWIRTVALAAACLCGMAAPLAHQQSQPTSIAPGTGVIAGRVVDAATGAGISNVTVNLGGQSAAAAARGAGPRVLTTDSQGRFIFVGLVRGIYVVRTQRAGYTLLTSFVADRPVELAAGQRFTDLTIRLRRLASVAGTVSDENGDPVVGMGVIAFRRTLVNGQLVSLAASEIRTDDRGAYRLTSLQTGDYVVCACRRDSMPVDGVLLSTLASDATQLIGLASRALKVGADAASLENVRTFGPAFYPGTPLVSRATKITLADGDEKTGVDIQVGVVRSARISGRVIGAPGAVSASAIRLRPSGEMPEAAPVIEPMLVQTDGRFDFTGVAPGSYVLNVSMSPTPLTGGGPTGAALTFIGGRGSAPVSTNPPGTRLSIEAPLWAQVPIVVGDADITDITVALKKSARVFLTAEMPAVAPQPGGRPLVASYQLTPLPFDYRAISTLGRTFPDGSTILSGFAPGRYYLTAIGVASTLQLSKVTLRGDDVTDMPIDIGDTDITDLVVTFVPSKFAEISGTVGGDYSETSVVIFPADRRLWIEPAAARRWFSYAPVWRSGSFSSGQVLLPGDYLVALVPDDQVAEFQQQPRLEALALRAQKITLAAGEMKTIDLKR